VSGNISNPSTGLPSKDGIVFLNRYESIRGYKNVIIVSVEGPTQKDRKRQDEEILLRRKEIFNNLSAGSHICILYPEKDDPLVKDVLRNLSIRFIRSAEALTQPEIKRSEFRTFLRDHGTAFGIFSLELVDSYVICTVKNLKVSPIEISENIPKYKGGFVAGFTKKIGRGLLTVLPFFLSYLIKNN
jgi:hypothetical protein